MSELTNVFMQTDIDKEIDMGIHIDIDTDIRRGQGH